MIRKFLKNRKYQKCLLPLSLIFILPVWLTLRKDVSPLPPVLYVSCALAFICFILDRILKPWDLERAEMREAQARQAYAESKENQAEAARQNETEPGE